MISLHNFSFSLSASASRERASSLSIVRRSSLVLCCSSWDSFMFRSRLFCSASSSDLCINSALSSDNFSLVWYESRSEITNWSLLSVLSRRLVKTLRSSSRSKLSAFGTSLLFGGTSYNLSSVTFFSASICFLRLHWVSFMFFLSSSSSFLSSRRTCSGSYNSTTAGYLNKNSSKYKFDEFCRRQCNKVIFCVTPGSQLVCACIHDIYVYTPRCPRVFMHEVIARVLTSRAEGDYYTHEPKDL